jgi:hypothetical protein
MDHPSKTSQQKSPLEQSKVLQTNTSYNPSNPYPANYTSFQTNETNNYPIQQTNTSSSNTLRNINSYNNIPNNQENDFQRQPSSSRNSNSYGNAGPFAYPTQPTYHRTSSSSNSSPPPSHSSPPPSHSSTPSTTPSKSRMKQKYIAQPNKPSNITIKHQQMDEDSKYRGIYKPKFLVRHAKPTRTEQSALNKLSDKDNALKYLLYYFYFILFLDTLIKLWKKINVLNVIVI